LSGSFSHTPTQEQDESGGQGDPVGKAQGLLGKKESGEEVT
jgi:hypothetical protein